MAGFGVNRHFWHRIGTTYSGRLLPEGRGTFLPIATASGAAGYAETGRS